MTDPAFLDTPSGRRIAYRRTEGAGPGVVFLGGFRSDMEGTKAVHLEAWAQAKGRAFLRFDYSGHGQSSGALNQFQPVPIFDVKSLGFSTVVEINNAAVGHHTINIE